MPVSRIRLVPLALLVLSLVVAPSASAAGPVITTEVAHGDVPWTIPAGQCSSLPAGVSVSGTGKRQSVTITKTFPDGSMNIFNNDVVTGKAVDSNGRTYLFVYHNQYRETRPASASGGPNQVDMTDVFFLTGAGGKAIDAGFHWTWSYTPPEPFFPPAHNLVQLSTFGDPVATTGEAHCDPI